MNTIDLQVQGMSCGSCVKHVTQALEPLAGVTGVAVDLASGQVRVSGELAQGSGPLDAALTAAGYPAQPATATGSMSQPGSSGSQSSKVGRGGCCCN